MSYEHCDKHDQDATNGCTACMAEDARCQHNTQVRIALIAHWCANCGAIKFSSSGGIWMLPAANTKQFSISE